MVMSVDNGNQIPPFDPEVAAFEQRMQLISRAIDLRTNLRSLDNKESIARREEGIKNSERFVISSHADDIVPVEYDQMSFAPSSRHAAGYESRHTKLDEIAIVRLRLPSAPAVLDVAIGGAGDAFQVNDVFLEIIRKPVSDGSQLYLLNADGLFPYKTADDLMENPDYLVEGNMFSVVGAQTGELETIEDEVPIDAITVVQIVLENYQPIRITNERETQSDESDAA